MLTVIDLHPEAELSFDEFWTLFYKNYPHKRMPKQAEKAAKKIAPSEYVEVLIGLNNFIKYLIAENVERKHIPYPATWLNGGAWMDEYEIKLSRHSSHIPFQLKGEEKFEHKPIPENFKKMLDQLRAKK